MTHASPPAGLRLTGARVLVDGAFEEGEVGVGGAHLTPPAGPPLDLRGFCVLPGIIDLHGDAFERHLSPRPRTPFPLPGALLATDRDAAINGVTTAYLAQSWSWSGGPRGYDAAEALLAACDAARATMLTDLRVQLRCEIHTVDTQARLIEAVRRHGVGYVVFNDHLAEAVRLARAMTPRFLDWAREHGRRPEDHRAAIEAAHEEAARVPRYLCNLAQAFDEMGVAYGSHDDADAQTRERFAMIGARICEFPTSRAAAALARTRGDPVILGAPNVVRGGSQAGNVGAADLIREGLCDALVSDYHYPSLAAAAFHLAGDGLANLPAAWDLISGAPARILRLRDRGRLATGLRADLVVIDPETRRVEATMAGGRWSFVAAAVAERLAAMPGGERAGCHLRSAAPAPCR